jgi:hypothetical protein
VADHVTVVGHGVFFPTKHAGYSGTRKLIGFGEADSLSAFGQLGPTSVEQLE